MDKRITRHRLRHRLYEHEFSGNIAQYYPDDDVVGMISPRLSEYRSGI